MDLVIRGARPSPGTAESAVSQRFATALRAVERAGRLRGPRGATSDAVSCPNRVPGLFEPGALASREIRWVPEAGCRGVSTLRDAGTGEQ